MSWKVTAQAPTRVDLAGGTLDLWPVHFLLKESATVNVSVTLEATVEVTPSTDGKFHFVSDDQQSRWDGSLLGAFENKVLPLPGRMLQSTWHSGLPAVTVTSRAKSPAGAGLGGSSCLAVTLQKALLTARGIFEKFQIPDEAKLVRTAQDAEALIIHAPTGCQDYWGAVRGGVNVIRFPFGGETVETTSPQEFPALGEQMILCYSGKSRASAINNWMIFKRTFDGDERTLKILGGIGEAAVRCARSVKARDLVGVLKASEEEWNLRRELWPDITTVETENLDKAAKAAGATFSRVCGAGGGGVMAVFASAPQRPAVISALTAAGGTVLPAGPSGKGLFSVIEN